MKSLTELNENIKRLFFRFNLTVIAAGGYLALWSFLQVKSNAQQTWMLGYSWKIVLVGALLFLLVSSLAVVGLRAWLGKDQALLQNFLHPAGKTARALIWMVLAAALALGGFLALVSQQQFDGAIPQSLLALVQRITPLLAWLTAGVLQTGLLWLLFQPHRESTAGDPAKALLLVSLALTVLYALLVVLPLPWLPSGWAWSRSLRPFRSQGLWALLVLVVLFILVNVWLSGKKTRPVLKLAGLVVIAYALALAVGQGPAKIGNSLLNSKPGIYLEKACMAQSPAEVIRYYDEEYTDHHWLVTKPPGLLAFYTLLRQVLVPDRSLSVLQCHQQYARLGAWLLPLLSALLLLPVYFFGRHLVGEEAAWLACAFYLTTTSLAKFARFADVFLFPLLFLTTLVLLYLALRRSSPSWALAAGAASAFCILVSFSLLPLLGVALAWLVMHFLGCRQERARLVLTLAGYLAGLLLLTLLFYVWLGYDPLTRYRAAMAAHTTFKLFRSGFGQTLNAVSVNNLEYFAFSGLALSVLFIYRFVKAFWDKRLDELTLFEELLWAAAAAYLVMNLVGKTIGEVGRIWMFFTPLLCLGAADVVEQQFKGRRRPVNLLLALQVAALLLNISFLLILY